MNILGVTVMFLVGFCVGQLLQPYEGRYDPISPARFYEAAATMCSRPGAVTVRLDFGEWASLVDCDRFIEELPNGYE